jgi:hypothetical protein
MTKTPETTKIAVLREVRRQGQKETAFAKPAWVAGIIQQTNKKRRDAGNNVMVKYMIDFGTGKMALTDDDGRQADNFYAEYRGTTHVFLSKAQEQTILIDTYFERLEKFLADQGLTFKNVAARFTGDFRLPAEKMQGHRKLKKATYFKMVKARGMDFGCLDIVDEAKFGSQHTLDIATPYIEEYNKASIRGSNRLYSPIKEVLILEWIRNHFLGLELP